MAAFKKKYGRATDIFLKTYGFSEMDAVLWVCRNQKAWEAFKVLVKGLTTVWNTQHMFPDVKKYVEENRKYAVAYAIRELTRRRRRSRLSKDE